MTVMEWTVDMPDAGPIAVRWTDGALSGPPHMIETVAALAAAGEILAPVPGTAIPAGLVSPLEAWATVTVALQEHRPWGTVRTPEPPVSLAAEGEDRIY